MSLIVAPRASSRFLNRVDDTCPSSLLDLSPISGQSWVGHGAAIDLSALPIPHSPSLIGTGSTELVSEVQDYNDIRIMGAIEDRIMLSTSNLPQMDAVLITTFVLPNTSETSSTEGVSEVQVSYDIRWFGS